MENHLLRYSYISSAKIVKKMEPLNKIRLGIFIIVVIILLDGESFAISAITINERKKVVNFMHILLGIHSVHEIISHNSRWNTNKLN